jgi:hypothetical protein
VKRPGEFYFLFLLESVSVKALDFYKSGKESLGPKFILNVKCK